MIRGLGDKPTSANVGKVYDTKNWAPRIGFAWDVTGDQKTVLKAHYGQYFEAAFFTLYQRALPGTQDQVLYFYDGETRNRAGRPGSTSTTASRSRRSTRSTRTSSTRAWTSSRWASSGR